LPSREERNARVLPSADQAGALSRPLCVNCRAASPAVLVTQMLLALRFASMSGVETANATHFPSGETCGAETRCNCIKSSNVIGCFARACAFTHMLAISAAAAAHPTLASLIVFSLIPRGTILRNRFASQTIVRLTSIFQFLISSFFPGYRRPIRQG